MAALAVQDQGSQGLRNEAYTRYAAATKTAAQRRYWSSYGLVDTRWVTMASIPSMDNSNMGKMSPMTLMVWV